MLGEIKCVKGYYSAGFVGDMVHLWLLSKRLLFHSLRMSHKWETPLQKRL